MFRKPWIALFAFVLALGAAAAFADETNELGLPNPEKPDVPYLIHANNLVETEVSEAHEEVDGKKLSYWIEGASSPVKTPLASPQFLYRAGQITPDRLQLYRFEPNKGRREILLRKKKKMLAEPIFLSIFTAGEGLYKLRTDQVLPAGEYCLTPTGANSVFCFEVY